MMTLQFADVELLLFPFFAFIRLRTSEPGAGAEGFTHRTLRDPDDIREMQVWSLSKQTKNCKSEE